MTGKNILGGTWKETRHEPIKCPKCGYSIDATSHAAGLDTGNPERAEPHPGDLSICINCGTVNEFVTTSPMIIKEASPEKLESLSVDMKVAIATLQSTRNVAAIYAGRNKPIKTK
jgi:hypothetical protein